MAALTQSYGPRGRGDDLGAKHHGRKELCFWQGCYSWMKPTPWRAVLPLLPAGKAGGSTAGDTGLQKQGWEPFLALLVPCAEGSDSAPVLAICS